MHSLLRSTASTAPAGDALDRLACIGAELEAISNRALPADESLHEVSAVVHRLIAELIRAEREGHSRDEIAEALIEARDRSSHVALYQTGRADIPPILR